MQKTSEIIKIAMAILLGAMVMYLYEVVTTDKIVLASAPMTRSSWGGQQQGSIFAFPGTACPAGSDLYKGPESKMPQATPAVYCMTNPKVTVFEKSATEKNRTCPPSMKQYTDPAYTPDSDVLWCVPDPDFKIPPPPEQPPL